MASLAPPPNIPTFSNNVAAPRVGENDVDAGLKITRKKLDSAYAKKNIVFVNKGSKVVGSRKIGGILDSWSKQTPDAIGLIVGVFTDVNASFPTYLAGTASHLSEALMFFYSSIPVANYDVARALTAQTLQLVITPQVYVNILRKGNNLSQTEIYQKNAIDALISSDNAPDVNRATFQVRTRNGKNVADTEHNYSLSQLIAMAKAVSENRAEKKPHYVLLGQTKNKEATEANASGAKSKVTFLELFDKTVELAKKPAPPKTADKKASKDKRSINLSAVKPVYDNSGRMINITGAKAVAPPTKDTKNYYGAYNGGQDLDVIWGQNLDVYKTVLDFLVANGRGSAAEANYLKGQANMGTSAVHRYNVNGATQLQGTVGPMSAAPFVAPAQPTAFGGMPTQGFGQSVQSFGQPAAPTMQPAQVFGQPAQVFGQPAAPTMQPAQVFGQPAAPTMQPAQVFGQPAAPTMSPPRVASPGTAAASDLANELM
jgi:hypothetical protein